MAVALFGSVVTIILSAQAGLVASDRTAINMSQAIEIARCRMSEIEEKELKLGYPEIEEKDMSRACCNEKEVAGFSCEWKIERILLPQPQGMGGDAGLGSLLGGGLGLTDGGLDGALAFDAMPPTSIAGPMGTTLINPLGGAGLDFDAGLQNIGAQLQQSMGGAGMSGLLTMVFSLVYPSLKPMLEAGIRKVTVTIHWNEGLKVRDFVLTQYLTNPSRAGLLADVMDAGGFAEGGGLPTSLGGSSPGAAVPGLGLPPGLGISAH